MARISILLTHTMIQSLERIQRVQPFSSRAAVMSAALETGLVSLSNGMAMPVVMSKAKRRTSQEPAERLGQRLGPSENAVVDAPDTEARKPPEVTAAHVMVGSSPPGDPDWAFLDDLANDGKPVKANPFTGE